MMVQFSSIPLVQSGKEKDISHTLCSTNWQWVNNNRRLTLWLLKLAYTMIVMWNYCLWIIVMFQLMELHATKILTGR